MKPSLALVYLSLAIAPALVVGCNAVLGNEHGDPLDGGPPVDTFDAGLHEDSAGPADATLPRVDAEADGGQTGQCSAGEKICFGQCVSRTDPVYGCDIDGCVPCRTYRATSVCAAGRCAISACEPGYADCNVKSADGCETDLSDSTHCGACNAVCQAGAPFCAPSGASFACSTNCPAQASTLCGTQCVDLDTSATHCGNCTTACPVVANGREACVARVCQLSCDASFHKCGDACVSNTDPATCGGNCTPCTAPANATPTCSGAGVCGWVCNAGYHACGSVCMSNNDVASCGPTSCIACPSTNATPSCNGFTCSFACAPGYGDCDKAAANGCEAPLNTDANNCGVCGHSCSGNPCAGGQCQLPDSGPTDSGSSSDTGPG